MKYRSLSFIPFSLTIKHRDFAIFCDSLPQLWKNYANFRRIFRQFERNEKLDRALRGHCMIVQRITCGFRAACRAIYTIVGRYPANEVALHETRCCKYLIIWAIVSIGCVVPALSSLIVGIREKRREIPEECGQERRELFRFDLESISV